MSRGFCIDDTVNTLRAVFDKHRKERVFVLGTTCVGKTSLLAHFPEGVDMDAVAFANITEEEREIINRTPWTTEIGEVVDAIVYRNVKVAPGHPVFGTVIADCDVVVYLDISDALLAAHCAKRGVSISDAMQMKAAVEKDWQNHKQNGKKMFYYTAMAE